MHLPGSVLIIVQASAKEAPVSSKTTTTSCIYKGSIHASNSGSFSDEYESNYSSSTNKSRELNPQLDALSAHLLSRVQTSPTPHQTSATGYTPGHLHCTHTANTIAATLLRKLAKKEVRQRHRIATDTVPMTTSPTLDRSNVVATSVDRCDIGSGLQFALQRIRFQTLLANMTVNDTDVTGVTSI
ncbi:hypothetical protein BASA50_008766 [Batrachochytrium salamandrivorans]|uniref:Uncharacterized protein n=1 Tax=Batrachochytrium salamandrivorans TaxID=1357716 RepID=A0ABQ8F630_9FUNG|nr:hypothetical protein BASA62_007831 [Batrachochytrium salamandrivorans]KAH6578938.1 hypothetical protein BASA60_003475 [Batrachochytrium salamandrivorans]KAH6591322.1 hypothetical protein BASA50_008766 [Batrachochytrium salamandrivorans]KAJ1342365.1 hypothetical protein BSLG_003050 [Batrachochytrium salamandrivorans]